ncbi:DUF1707 domain-containing protein [Nocardia sp. NPDC020380]|uniref:DUF1707 domain-containing protein n=1 Tax=Nocardia sp. NPDC020380 TaxID=3364309 RepID=UPI00379D90D3
MTHPDERDKRASDIDRSTVCARLDSAYADGELDFAEHDERTHTAMSAKTRGELSALTVDLQGPPLDFGPPPAAATPVPAPNRTRLWILLGAGAIALIVLGAVLAWASNSNSKPGVQTPVPASSASSAPTTSMSDQGHVVTRNELVNAIGSDFRNDEGHNADRITCPSDLPAQNSAIVVCTITDRGNQYPATITVVSLQGNNITYNVRIDGLP